MTKTEAQVKLFDKYVDQLKTRSLKWSFPNNNWFDNRRIKRFLKYFCIPCKLDEVLGFLDTTPFRTGKEGFLFLTSGIVVKEVLNKLYYLQFSKMERAEIVEKTDVDTGEVTTSLWIHFTEGEDRKVFDYYLSKYSYAEYINEAIKIEKTMI